MTQAEREAAQRAWVEQVADFQASGQSQPQWATAREGPCCN
ncbi:MAG: hypothetical protein M0Z53_15665 [Thermaerobacter sp.]|nr:hypothetical protein [Thermaerobacter sp.]